MFRVDAQGGLQRNFWQTHEVVASQGPQLSLLLSAMLHILVVYFQCGQAIRMQDYFMLYGRHQKETILNHMPDGFKDIAKQSAGSVRGDMIPLPDQDKHVFCRVLADRGYVEMNAAGYV